MVFNATFYNISVILVKKTGKKHRPVASHWETLSHNVVSSIMYVKGAHLEGFSITTMKGALWLAYNDYTYQNVAHVVTAACICGKHSQIDTKQSIKDDAWIRFVPQSHRTQGRIQGGGGTRRPPPLNLEKIWFFGIKSCFFTRNTLTIFAPPSARRNFFKCAPLTWNPGSAPGTPLFRWPLYLTEKKLFLFLLIWLLNLDITGFF